MKCFSFLFHIQSLYFRSWNSNLDLELKTGETSSKHNVEEKKKTSELFEYVRRDLNSIWHKMQMFCFNFYEMQAYSIHKFKRRRTFFRFSDVQNSCLTPLWTIIKWKRALSWLGRWIEWRKMPEPPEGAEKRALISNDEMRVCHKYEIYIRLWWCLL